MRNLLLTGLLVIALIAVANPVLAARNAGPAVPATFHGNVLTPLIPAAEPPVMVLYAPSESDDAGYRAAIVAGSAGRILACDYFDARYGTPDASLLANYEAVMTWANYAYADNVLFGNNLADFVDAGGDVVLGAFCAYTSGNYLAGRIMDDPNYCPVTGGTNHFTLAMWDGVSSCDCWVYGVTSWGATYRDYLTLRTQGVLCARFTDGEIAIAGGYAGFDDFEVYYANGMGGYPLGPVGDQGIAIANMCECFEGGTATEPTTWGTIKSLYH